MAFSDEAPSPSAVWLGNVRELEHLIRRAVLMTPGPLITRAELPAELADGTTSDRNPEPAIIADVAAGGSDTSTWTSHDYPSPSSCGGK